MYILCVHLLLPVSFIIHFPLILQILLINNLSISYHLLLSIIIFFFSSVKHFYRSTVENWYIPPIVNLIITTYSPIHPLYIYEFDVCDHQSSIRVKQNRFFVLEIIFFLTNITDVCSLDCGPNGVCESGKCRCVTGWAGNLCDQLPCDSRCAEHGQCKNGTCVCSQGWNGRHCTLRKCFFFFILLLLFFLQRKCYRKCFFSLAPIYTNRL